MFAIGGLSLLCVAALVQFSADVTIWLFAFGLIHILVISLTLQRQALSPTRGAILTYSIILSAISLVCYQQSISLGTPLQPYLMGSDGQGYFEQATTISGSGGSGGILDRLSGLSSNYLGYQLVLSLVFDLMQRDLIVGLLLNNTALVLTVITLAQTTFLITRDPRSAYYSAIAFMLTAKFVYYANSLLKEPFLVLGVALVAHAFALLKHGRSSSLGAYAGLAAAVLIFGTMRLPMLILLPCGVVLLGKDILRKGWLMAALGVGVAGSLAAVFATFTTHEFNEGFVQGTATQNTVLDQSFDSGIDAGGVVGRIMGGYTQLPLPARIVTVPVPAIIQFVLPFDFWSTMFIDDHVLSLLNANLNIVWYLYTGVFALFTLFYWRRLPDQTLKLMFALGMALYLMIAFVFGGALPRYATPYTLLMLPAVGVWMNAWRSNGPMAATLTRFFRIYYSGFAMAGVAYMLFQFSRSA